MKTSGWKKWFNIKILLKILLKNFILNNYKIFFNFFCKLQGFKIYDLKFFLILLKLIFINTIYGWLKTKGKGII